MRRAPTVAAGVRAHLADRRPEALLVTEPNSWDARQLAARLGAEIVRWDQFLTHPDEFAARAGERKVLRLDASTAGSASGSATCSMTTARRAGAGASTPTTGCRRRRPRTPGLSLVPRARSHRPGGAHGRPERRRRSGRALADVACRRARAPGRVRGARAAGVRPVRGRDARGGVAAQPLASPLVAQPRAAPPSRGRRPGGGRLSRGCGPR